MTERPSGGPIGWVNATIGEVAKISSGFGFPERYQGKKSGELPFAKVRDISNCVKYSTGHLHSADNYVDQTDLLTLRAKAVPAGSTAFAKIGEALRLNRRAFLRVDAILDNNCMAVTPEKGIEPEYLYYFLTTVDLAPFAVATTVPSVRRGDVEGVKLWLPPREEQRRIIAKIDSLSAKSRRARSRLDHIPRLVEKYKQAMLSAAFQGELTREWRGRLGTSAPAVVPLRALCASITDGDHQAPPRAESGTPFITISAMNDGVIDLNKATRFVPQSYVDGLKASRRPSIGDVLYSVTGSFGIPAAVVFDKPFVFQRHIAILKPDHAKVQTGYLHRLLGAPQVMEQAQSVATGTAQKTVPLSGLREFLIPHPPLDEQREVTRCIDNAFAWIDRLASEATSARKLIDHLDRSVLAKAFRGELAPQDPNDEPASALLVRIRASREAAPTKNGIGKGAPRERPLRGRSGR